MAMGRRRGAPDPRHRSDFAQLTRFSANISSSAGFARSMARPPTAGAGVIISGCINRGRVQLSYLLVWFAMVPIGACDFVVCVFVGAFRCRVVVGWSVFMGG